MSVVKKTTEVVSQLSDFKRNTILKLKEVPIEFTQKFKVVEASSMAAKNAAMKTEEDFESLKATLAEVRVFGVLSFFYPTAPKTSLIRLKW
jgi:hypothetical protein